MSDGHAPWLSYLDALRPEPGWRVDLALLATYSADCVSVVAAMLALAGLDDDRGSGSKVDFANAFEQLKGRLHVVMQSSRLAVPRQRIPVLRLLDRFVVPVDADEREFSWHPKLALVRMTSAEDKYPNWRLWIGSRNLTRDAALDTGLLLISTRESNGAPLSGAAEVARRLLVRAGRSPEDIATHTKELARLSWASPAGVTPVEMRLSGPDDRREWPALPDDARELWVVSPFLDAGTVSRFANSGRHDAQRYLVSTPGELLRLGAQSASAFTGYARLLSFESPPPEPGEPGLGSSDETVAVTRDEEIEPQGLHAKLLMAKHGHAWTVWLGSANATQRGWKRNHEVIIQFESAARVAEGLIESLSTGVEFRVDEGVKPAMESAAELQLEENRKRVTGSWVQTLRLVAAGHTVEAEGPPPIDPDVSLEIGPLAGARHAWPREQALVALGGGADGVETELFEMSLRLGNLWSAWVQRVPSDRPFTDDRDHRILARFLDPRTFMAWIRDLLVDQPLTDGGGPWDADHLNRSHGRLARARSAPPWMPTLEEVLRAAARQPAVLLAVDRKLRRYLAHLPNDMPAADREVLREFEAMWQLVRSELVQRPPT
jgi:hypothetical protein